VHDRVKAACSPGLSGTLRALITGESHLTFKQLRQNARNFTGTELQKELDLFQHIQPWMAEIQAVLASLSLSLKNLQHYAERVDYYGAKLKRQSVDNQGL
jgi:hypothetical protein